MIAQMETVTATVPISQIRTDGGTQARQGLDVLVVGEYAHEMKEGAVFPALTVFYDGDAYWLADGFHRLAAAKAVGQVVISCDVRQGTRRDAVLFACGANATHGLKRSDDDKRRAVLALLNDSEWRQWSDREIARRCNVSAPFVGKLRAEAAPTVNVYSNGGSNGVGDVRTYERNGKTQTMSTNGIGKAATIPTERHGTASSSKPDPDPWLKNQLAAIDEEVASCELATDPIMAYLLASVGDYPPSQLGRISVLLAETRKVNRSEIWDEFVFAMPEGLSTSELARLLLGTSHVIQAAIAPVSQPTTRPTPYDLLLPMSEKQRGIVYNALRLSRSYYEPRTDGTDQSVNTFFYAMFTEAMALFDVQN